MKKVVLVLLAILMITCACLAFTACKTNCDKGEHTWDSGIITKEPTCVEDGVRTFRCKLCDHDDAVKTEVIPATGVHTPKDVSVAATCTTAGSTGQTQCTVCNAPIDAGTVVAALGHNFDESKGATVTSTLAATCTTDGAKVVKCSRCTETTTVKTTDKLGHDFEGQPLVKDGDKHYQQCKRDGCTEHSEAVDHVWGAGVVTTPASCTTEGVRTFTCACTATKTETVSTIPHNYVLKTSATEHWKECSVCQAKDPDNMPKGHTYGDDFRCECGAVDRNIKFAVKVGSEGEWHRADTLTEAVGRATQGETLSIVMGQDMSGDGVFIGEHMNVAIDFGGNTYTVTGNPVGHAGTESQAFHLDATSVVFLQNGIITSSSGSGVKMLVQNYSDLSLKDITLDGSNLDANGANAPRYTLSNNFGVIRMQNVAIKASANDGVALDVFYATYDEYASGVSVTVDADSVIEGVIEYGSAKAVDDLTGKAVLSLPAGEYTIRFSANVTDCDKTDIKIGGVKLTHDMGEWKVTQYPNCVDEGEKERTCKLCGKAETEAVPANGHTMTQATYVGQHRHTGECTVCHLTETVACVDVDGVCSACGRTQYPNVGGTVTIVSSEQDYANEQVIPTLTQGDVTLAFDKGTGQTAPAYYDTGLGIRLYSGGTLTISVPEGGIISSIVFAFTPASSPNGEFTANVGNYNADSKTWTGEANSVTFNLGGTKGHYRLQKFFITYQFADKFACEENDHFFGDWKVTTEAGCTTDGEKTRVCLDCGHKETEAIPAAHKLGELNDRVEPSCAANDGQGANGHVAYYQCAVCNKYFDTDKTTEIAEADITLTWKHDLKFVDGVEPEVGKPGSKPYYHCDVCNRDYEDKNAAKLIENVDEWKVIDEVCEHDETTWTKETVDGVLTHEKVCGKCNNVLESHPATGNMGEWTVVEDPECEKAGERKRTCTVCGIEETEVIPANGHSMTYTYVGQHKHDGECSVCGAVVEDVACTNVDDVCSVCGRAQYAFGGDTVTIDPSTNNYTNQTVITTLEKDDVTLDFDKGTNSLTPKYFTSDTTIRLYGGGTLTVTVPEGAIITSIEFDSSGNTLTAGAGTLNGNSWTGTGEENSVVFAVSGTSGNRAFKGFVITYKYVCKNNDHFFGAWNVTEAGCTTDGEKTRVCLDCEYEESEVIPAAHKLGELNDRVEPDCEGTGHDGHVAYYKCTVCNKYFDTDKTTEIAEADITLTWHHDMEYFERVPAKVGVAGTKAYYHCKGCNRDYEDEEATKLIDNIEEWKVIPALAEECTHVNTTWQETVVNGVRTHNQVCNNQDCGQIVATHTAEAGSWSENGGTHVQACAGGCDITFASHTAEFADEYTATVEGGVTYHAQVCASCSLVANKHEQNLNDGYETTTNGHYKTCAAANCTYATDTVAHSATTFAYLTGGQHKGTCVCGAEVIEDCSVDNSNVCSSCGRIVGSIRKTDTFVKEITAGTDTITHEGDIKILYYHNEKYCGSTYAPLRFYNNDKLTISVSSDDYLLTKIVIEYASGYIPADNKITAEIGGINETDTINGTGTINKEGTIWTGEAQKVILTNTHTSQYRISSITVEYTLSVHCYHDGGLVERSQKVATCTEDGYTLDCLACEKCGLLFTDNTCTELSASAYTPALGHNFSEEWTDGDVDGVHKHWHLCTNGCGEKQDVTACQGVSGNDAVAAKCEEVGYTASVVCGECGATLTARTEIPALGHELEYDNTNHEAGTHYELCVRGGEGCGYCEDNVQCTPIDDTLYMGNASGHYRLCGCGYHIVEAHNYGDDSICIDCGFDASAVYVDIVIGEVIGGDESGITTSLPEKAIVGDTVTFTVTVNDNYDLISVGEAYGTVITYNEDTNEYSFVVPEDGVMLSITVCKLVTVTYDAPANATIKVDAAGANGYVKTDIESGNKVRIGATLTITITPNEGYKLADKISVGGGENNCELNEGKYTYAIGENTQLTTIAIVATVDKEKSNDPVTLTIKFITGKETAGYESKDNEITWNIKQGDVGGSSTAPATNKTISPNQNNNISLLINNCYGQGGYIMMIKSTNPYVEVKVPGTIQSTDVTFGSSCSVKTVYYAATSNASFAGNITPTTTSVSGVKTLAANSYEAGGTWNTGCSGGSYINITANTNNNGQIAKIVITYIPD